MPLLALITLNELSFVLLMTLSAIIFIVITLLSTVHSLMTFVANPLGAHPLGVGSISDWTQFFLTDCTANTTIAKPAFFWDTA